MVALRQDMAPAKERKLRKPREPREPLEPAEQEILIDEKLRDKLAKGRTRLGLTTRALSIKARKAFTNATVTNIEKGLQRTLKLSAFVAYWRALFGEDPKDVDDLIAKQKLAKQIAERVAHADTQELELVLQHIKLVVKSAD